MESTGDYAKREYLNWDSRIRGVRIRVGIAWCLDVVIMAVTIFAVIVFAFLATDVSDSELQAFVQIDALASIILSVIIVAVVTHRSFNMSLNAFGGSVEKQTSGVVYNVVEEIAIAAGMRSVPDVYIAYTSIPNACAISDGKRNVVIVTSELLEILDRNELQAVVAHEMGHIVSGDSPAMTKLVALVSVTGIVSGAASRMIIGYGDSDDRNPLAVILILVCLLFLIVAPIASSLVSSKSSRDRERRADAYAAKLTRNPTALATALLRLDGDDPDVDKHEKSAYDKAEAIMFRIPSRKDRSGAFDSHPTTHERVQAMIDMGAVLPSTLQIGGSRLTVAQRMASGLR